jgi:hypothetical protein
LKENPNIDWVGVISSFHKWLDTLIETFITKWFRKFAKKDKKVFLKWNDPLEKQLNLVCGQWYIMSVWRLFHLLKMIKNTNTQGLYVQCFKDYLNKYSFISDILYTPSFYNNFRDLIQTELLWKKRHSWTSNFKETTKARTLFIWDFTNKDCLIYKFIELWKVDY